MDALAGERCDHLVRVHVRARAGARLEDVDRELVVELAGGDAVGGGRDALGHVAVEQLEVGVHARGSGLDAPEPARDGDGDRLAGDGEVPDRLLGLATPELLGVVMSVMRPSVEGEPRQGVVVSPQRTCARIRTMRREVMPDLWEPAGTYLNTASYGLPPRPAWEALQDALADWRGGRTSWEHWGEPGEQARASFARIVGVPVETVAIAPNVSSIVGRRRRVDPGRKPSSRARRRVHLASVPVPRAGAPGRLRAARPARRACGRDRAGRRRRRVQRGADGDRRGGRPRGDRLGGDGERRDDGRRRHAGSRLAPLRRRALRRRRRTCLQVADVPQGHGFRSHPPRPPRAGRAARGRVVCGRGSAADVLRAAAPARGERPQVRHVAGLVHVGGDRAGARRHRADRRSCDPRARRGAREPVPLRARARRPATPRSSCRTPPARRRSSSGRASARQSVAAASARRGTSTTPRPTSSGRSTCWRAEGRRPSLEQLRAARPSCRA